MKNNGKKRIASGTAAAVLTAALVGVCGYPAQTAEVCAEETAGAQTDVQTAGETEELQEAAEKALGDTGSGEDGGFYKEESVYVKADASGNVKETTVTEWLKNPGSGDVADSSGLKDIENVKGEEEFTKGSDEELIWKSVGEDIYYQGTTTKELPVDVKVTYKLDGKSIAAKDLEGKDGKAEIHIEYTNRSKETVSVNGEEVEMYTPFAMVTALILPTDEYKNVTVDNGKVVSDEDRNIVVGMAFPGLKENLNLQNLSVDIPESVTITADVEDASVNPTLTMASANVVDMLNLDEIEDFDSFVDSVNQLDSAAAQLVDGSGQLSDGADTLDSKTAELTSGVNELADGVSAYTGGVSDLATGSTQLLSGADALRQGAAQAQSGVASAKAGADALVAGYDSLYSGVDTLSSGLAAFSTNLPDASTLASQYMDMVEGALPNSGDAALNEIQKQVLQQVYIEMLTNQSGKGLLNVVGGAIGQLQTGVTNLRGGVDQLYNGTVDLQTGLSQLNDGSAALVQGTDTLYNGVYALQQGAAQLNASGSLLTAGTQQLQSGSQQFAAGVSTLAEGSNTLASSMAEFKTVGIDKLTEIFNGDIKNVTERIDAMQTLGQQYTSFAGAKDGTAGSTKFIIETEGI